MQGEQFNQIKVNTMLQSLHSQVANAAMEIANRDGEIVVLRTLVGELEKKVAALEAAAAKPEGEDAAPQETKH